MSRYYVLTIGDPQVEHRVSTTTVLPWLAGYLARLATESAAFTRLAQRITAQMTPLPGEIHDQTCYRVLRICHDQHILVHRGITDQGKS